MSQGDLIGWKRKEPPMSDAAVEAARRLVSDLDPHFWRRYDGLLEQTAEAIAAYTQGQADKAISHFITVHQSMDILVRERDAAINQLTDLTARLASATTERENAIRLAEQNLVEREGYRTRAERLERHLAECHTRATSAEAAVEQARRAYKKLTSVNTDHTEAWRELEAALTSATGGAK
jgi:chromosome segregation ATPase